jgi:lysyl endopeptidase
MKYSLKLLFVALMVGVSLSVFGQQSALPWSMRLETLPKEVPVMAMPQVDVPSLLAEDEVNHALKIGPYRFGENMEVEATLFTHGVWNELKDGSRVWRMGFQCRDAYSVNFIMDDFYLPFGATFHIYNIDGSDVYGPFTYDDNREDNGFATFPIPGSTVFLEVYEPAMAIGQARLSVETVTHGYRDIFGRRTSDSRNSGACNINVNCPEGDDWQDEKRSVAIMVSGGSGFCTGAMVNNTTQDGTPYFLSANHCMGGNANNWVFKFDYERPGCANTGGPGSPTSGSFTQGATIRASSAGSDFALLQLNATPPASHNIFYAGWDRTGAVPPNSIGIHHPQGDRKKICFDNDPATAQNWQGAACWRIGNWEEGTTEPASSGSPLFDPNHRIIGQLFGGTASCTSITNDFYGRFSVSWDGNSASSRLRDWLDPLNTNVSTLDGYDPNAADVALDAAVQSITGATQGQTICDTDVNLSFTLRNRGTSVLTSATINWTLNGIAQTPINWTGSLQFNQSTTISLPLSGLSDGNQQVVITVTGPNGGVDENAGNNSTSISFTIVSGSEMTLRLRTDGYPDETSWEIRTQGQLGTVVASGDGYDQTNSLLTIPVCLPSGCYTFTLFDDFGDGLCCEWGQGFFELLSPEGDLIGQGSQFEDEVSVNFCLPFQTGPNSVDDHAWGASVTVYPNPTDGLLRIVLPEGLDARQLRVTDLSGRVVADADMNMLGDTPSLDLSGLSNGLYHLSIFGTQGVVVRPVVVSRP